MLLKPQIIWYPVFQRNPIFSGISEENHYTGNSDGLIMKLAMSAYAFDNALNVNVELLVMEVISCVVVFYLNSNLRW